jgi:hypothetical protein
MSRYRTQVEHKATRVTVIVEANGTPQKATHRVAYEYPKDAQCTVPEEPWTWTEEAINMPSPPPPRVDGKLERKSEPPTGAKAEIIPPTKTS